MNFRVAQSVFEGCVTRSLSCTASMLLLGHCKCIKSPPRRVIDLM